MRAVQRILPASAASGHSECSHCAGDFALCEGVVWEVVIIPAGVTPLLQVADVFVFASVKQRLSQEFQRMRVTQQQVTVRDWIQLLARVPGWLQEKSWTEAFAATTGLEVTNHLEALQISHITSRARPRSSSCVGFGHGRALACNLIKHCLEVGMLSAQSELSSQQMPTGRSPVISFLRCQQAKVCSFVSLLQRHSSPPRLARGCWLERRAGSAAQPSHDRGPHVLVGLLAGDEVNGSLAAAWRPSARKGRRRCGGSSRGTRGRSPTP